jgi:hypothetical protein
VQKAIFEDIEKSEVSAPNQRAALAVMIEEAQSLLDHLRSADLSNRQTIFSNYPNSRLDHEPDERITKLGRFNRDIGNGRPKRTGWAGVPWTSSGCTRTSPQQGSTVWALCRSWRGGPWLPSQKIAPP